MFVWQLFLMKLFPTKMSLPQVIWHDNNCKIRAMLRNDPDPHFRDYFNNCAMPVDVFHFKSKHKESDVQCNADCNPAKWADLQTSDGKWRFNSSAAEMTNAWVGGFQAMVREMREARYDFFLDEVFRIRNLIIANDLEKAGAHPFLIPHELLLHRE